MADAVLTRDMRELLIDCAKEGLKIPLASQRAGIDSGELRAWLADPAYEDFATEYREAEAEYKMNLMTHANAQAMSGHWNSLQYLMDAAGLGGDAEEALNAYKKAVMEVLSDKLRQQPDKLREIAQEFQKRGL